jgi:hypothetical protein
LRIDLSIDAVLKLSVGLAELDTRFCSSSRWATETQTSYTSHTLSTPACSVSTQRRRRATERACAVHRYHILVSNPPFHRKLQAPHPRSQTPFDCCALSFQPFEHPVCARNKDGTGFVFDLVNIIPWLKRVPFLSGVDISSYILSRQHNNTNPITKEPLSPNDLIKLNYSRKPSGEIHDPISFKPFSEHSHIVAIATTGNVFLAESVRGGKDLLEEKKFKKYTRKFMSLVNSKANISVTT